MFALANFSSTISYLISSPPVIRIIASVALDVVPLAAFSFSQGLCISAQRLFPGLLILPSLESVVMSQLTGRARQEKVIAVLSLLFKAELACVAAAIIATSIAGPDIVAILSRAAYANYYYVLPILLGSLILITAYRLFELIANTSLSQHIFFVLWPVSLLAMLAMYLTAPSWGIASILFWPAAEITVRIAAMTFLLRERAVWRAFDIGRSLPIICCAVCTTALCWSVARLFPTAFLYFDLILATGAVLLFIAAIFVVRPLRRLECQTLLSALPRSFKLARKIALRLTRGGSFH